MHGVDRKCDRMTGHHVPNTVSVQWQMEWSSPNSVHSLFIHIYNIVSLNARTGSENRKSGMAPDGDA